MWQCYWSDIPRDVPGFSFFFFYSALFIPAPQRFDFTSCDIQPQSTASIFRVVKNKTLLTGSCSSWFVQRAVFCLGMGIITNVTISIPLYDSVNDTLNADREPKTHHQTNTNDSYIWIQSFHSLQNFCNRGGNTNFKYMNYVSIFVGTVWECLFLF